MARRGYKHKRNVIPLDAWWGLQLLMPEGGTVTLSKTGSPASLSLEVSTDAVSWQPWTLVGNDYTYNLKKGQRLCIRSTSTAVTAFSTSDSDYWKFALSGVCAAYGSVMSLVTRNPLATSLAGKSYVFIRLFSGCTSLVTAPELPATTLAPYCYYGTFYNCSSLLYAPELPATTLEAYCYYGMFRGCTSLVKVGTLAFRTTANYSCSLMFMDCSSLKTVPPLLATILKSNCYRRMFEGCSSLSEIRTYMTNISASSCLLRWLWSVGSNGDFYCDSNLTIPSGSDGIPSSWTRHDIQ